MKNVSLAFEPNESNEVTMKIFINQMNASGTLCATEILIDTRILNLPEDTWNVIVEID